MSFQSRIKYILKTHRNQACSLRLSTTSKTIIPADYTNREIAVLDLLFSINDKYGGVIYPDRRWIASVLNMCRKTVDRAIAKFKRDGFIQVINRGVKKSCLYIMSEIFKNPVVRWQLSTIFKSLSKLSVVFLFSTTFSSIRNVHQTDISLDIKEQVGEYTNIKRHTLSKERNFAPGFFTEIRGEEPSKIFSVEIPPALESFKSLKLTLAGKLYLSAYPNDVIVQGDISLKKKGYLENPMHYLLGTMNAICKSQGVAPCFTTRQLLYNKYHINASDNWILHEPLEKPVVDVTPSHSRKSFVDDKSSFNSNHSSMTERERFKTDETIEYHEKELAAWQNKLGNLDPLDVFANFGKGLMINSIDYHTKELVRLRKNLYETGS